jgi:hypothetical protein
MVKFAVSLEYPFVYNQAIPVVALTFSIALYRFKLCFAGLS